LNENLALAIKAGAFLLAADITRKSIFSIDIIQHIDIRQHMGYDIKKFYIRRTAYEVY